MQASGHPVVVSVRVIAETGGHQQVPPVQLSEANGIDQLLEVSAAYFERRKANAFERLRVGAFLVGQVVCPATLVFVMAGRTTETGLQ